MGVGSLPCLSLLCFFSFLLLLQSPNLTSAEQESYVVYFGEHPQRTQGESLLSQKRATESHIDLLASLLKCKEKARDAIFYSYTKHINGFAANLEEEEAIAISKYPGVISVFRNKGYKLHTTHSWEFLGLERDGRVPSKSLWTKSRFGEDTIIGNLDTGVWPESDSFKDEGMGPIPPKWKGICQNDSEEEFSCNRKLIGARYFNKGYQSATGPLNSSFNSPRDTDGHGTHTLSTAAGRFVPNASIYDYGNGTAKGGSPRARVAAYKVCWPPINNSECFDADIIAAFDAAIHDGVDVLSVSLGGDPSSYFLDGLAIGSFHAVKNGITVICSAGNSGPQPGTVSNTAPWILTVGASTMDREFPAYASYGNKRIRGQSLSSTSLASNTSYPVISSAEATAANASRDDAQLCYLGSLDPKKVKGKIVVCLRGTNARVEKGEAVLQAGGAGMILANDHTTEDEIIADAHVLPATHISYSEGLQVFSYLKSNKSPVGYITLPTTELSTTPAPFMAAFSSQGPNAVNPEILKPDITAPGVSVLASWSRASAPTGLVFDTRRVTFNSESGTSMSCPHVSGIAGLLKTLNPDWSPAAIRSAIMTTASIRDNEKEAITNSSSTRATPFSYGSGHVQPNRAMDPGLVYDLTTYDYLNFLCALGYNSTQISTFSTEPHPCPLKPVELENLNYPSITVPKLSGSLVVTRTVKNVGSPGTYTARVREPVGVSVTVRPRRLRFKEVGEERTFRIRLEAEKGGPAGYVFGMLDWSDGKHHVRSPIVVKALKSS